MSQIYHARDPYLISFLRMRGLKEASKEWDGGQIVFLFEDTPELEKEIDCYFACSVSVPPKQFADAVRDVFREFRVLKKNGRGRGNYEQPDPERRSDL